MLRANSTENILVLRQSLFYSFVLPMMNGIEILDSKGHLRPWLRTPEAVQGPNEPRYEKHTDNDSEDEFTHCSPLVTSRRSDRRLDKTAASPQGRERVPSLILAQRDNNTWAHHS